MKDEFLAKLAHELRNPLAPLATGLAILERDDIEPALRRRMHEIMKRQLQQLVRMIDDLLDVSRVSTGRLTLQRARIDLVEVVRAAVESVASAMQERRQRLVVDWPAPVWVSADRARLAQIFVNLLGNASRFTGPEGRIELAFAPGPGDIAVRIDDDGIGIDASMQRQVFEMFTQVDKAMEDGGAGLGLGLTLARRLAELHGGTIELASAGLGHGSSFTVRLPRLGPQDEPARVDGSEPAPSVAPPA